MKTLSSHILLGPDINNPPDLRSDVGGLRENFVIAERMGNLGT